MAKDYLEKYESVNSFVNTLNQRIETYTGEIYDPSFKFCGTNSLDEANDLFYHGDKENADKVKAKKVQMNTQRKCTDTRNNLYNSPCGFMPIVPKVLAGDPQNMLAIKKQTYQSTKVLNVVFDLWVNCGISKEERAEISVKVINVISGLEKNGYRINLYAGCEFELSDNVHAGILIKIKDSGKYTDSLRLAYPLINASFLRRHCFNWLNVSNTPNGKHKRYYGILHNDSKRFFSQYIKNASIFNFHNLKDMDENEIAKYIENAK